VGIVLQDSVRAFDKSNIEMHNCFRPGDIVKARVTAGVGGGTSRDSSVLLSTAEEDLGVVFARSPHTGALMVPRSWTEFECVQTKTKHKRKVGKPQIQ
jgi:exosome complex component CSL4